MFCPIIDFENFASYSALYFILYITATIFEHASRRTVTEDIFTIRDQDEFKKSMESVMETLDEHKDNIPEGTYVEMCNNVKDVWDCVT
mgnify:FL=1|jgi:hypothetical protein